MVYLTYIILHDAEIERQRKRLIGIITYMEKVVWYLEASFQPFFSLPQNILLPSLSILIFHLRDQFLLNLFCSQSSFYLTCFVVSPILWNLDEKLTNTRSPINSGNPCSKFTLICVVKLILPCIFCIIPF